VKEFLMLNELRIKEYVTIDHEKGRIILKNQLKKKKYYFSDEFSL